MSESKTDTPIRTVLGTFCVPIRAKYLKKKKKVLVTHAHKCRSVSYFPNDQNIKRWEISPRTTLLSRLRQAPGELIADIPHLKHLPYVHGKYSHLLITFCFSFIGLCFALNKNHMKTQSYGTRYAAPPWNSSITFLVFYLCKQKCSSNQCRLNCLKSAVGISVN